MYRILSKWSDHLPSKEQVNSIELIITFLNFVMMIQLVVCDGGRNIPVIHSSLSPFDKNNKHCRH